MENNIVCFGEVLWDVLPSGKKPGGAPMNVAYHLHKLGCLSAILSRLGNDQPGRELLFFLESIGLSGQYCQTDKSYPTSEVRASVGANHEVSYDILFPVAWDFIELSESFENMVKRSEAFVFGSLAARNKTSFDTLLSLLEVADFRVMDINLRPPHYNKHTITKLLKKTDLLKLNSSELKIISEWYHPLLSIEKDCIHMLQQEFEISEFIITKGSQGASYYGMSQNLNFPAYTVKVADTVGSGDSFLAAFLTKRLTRETADQALDFAMAVAAYITTQSGACPTYDQSDIEKFLLKQKSK